MSTWLYQLNPQEWSPETFRFEIWEGKHWHWGSGNKRGSAEPQVGDTVVFFYVPSGGDDPGIYGWAVLEKWDAASKTLYFIPAAPTDRLKMDPWWDDQVKALVAKIRGKMNQATLFEMDQAATCELRAGVRRWLCGAS